jgi:hypothetical protein
MARTTHLLSACYQQTAVLCFDVLAATTGSAELPDVIADSMRVLNGDFADTTPAVAASGHNVNLDTVSRHADVLRSAVYPFVRSLLSCLWAVHVRDEASVWMSLCDSGMLSGLLPSRVGQTVDSGISSVNSPAAATNVSSPSATASPPFTFESVPNSLDDSGRVLTADASAKLRLMQVVAHHSIRSFGRLFMVSRSSHNHVGKQIDQTVLTAMSEVASAAPGSVVWSLSRYCNMSDLQDDLRVLIRRIRSLISTVPLPSSDDDAPSTLLAGPAFRTRKHDGLEPGLWVHVVSIVLSYVTLVLCIVPEHGYRFSRLRD